MENVSVLYEKYPLSRNYYENPLEYGEKPIYEDVYKCICVYCLPKCTAAILFNVIESRVANWCRFYKIRRTKEQINKIRELTNIQKYGVAHPSCLPEVQEKVKQTSLQRYGVTNANKLQSIKDKIKQTNLDRYGVTSYAKTQESKEKVKQTCMEKYGVDSANKRPEKIEKTKQTNLERYGATCNLVTKEGMEKTKQTNRERYGVDWAMQSKEILNKSKQTFLKHYGTTNVSNSHLPREIVNILETRETFQKYIDTLENPTIQSIARDLGVHETAIQKRLKYLDMWDSVIHRETQAELDLKQYLPNFVTTRKAIPPYEIDLYNKDLMLGIEYNGTYWHCEKFRDKKYHQQKSNMAKENGIFLYHIWEYEWEDNRIHPIILSQLNNLLHKNRRLGARKCAVRLVSFQDSTSFLQNNHIQGKDNSPIRLGLYHNEELVAVMTFCKPRFNKKYQYELSRFCCKCGWNIVGGASKLFKYFIENYTPTSIITYSDCSKTKGTLYPMLGFKLLRQSSPNYIWTNSTCTKILSRYQCQKHLLKEYQDLGDTEVEIMHHLGYYQIWDCGNLVWEWIKD